MSAPELSIVIPAYNEGVHLAGVVRALAQKLGSSGIQYEICVVNNGSVDDTAAVIAGLHAEDQRIIDVELEKNQKYGGGILAGLARASGDVVGWAHADGQADPEDIVRIYRKMREGNYEVGKAVRIERHESPWRIVQGAVYARLFRTLFWTSYRDPNGTPKLLTRKALERVNLTSIDWFLDPELVIKAIRYRLPMCEIDTVWHKRKSGSTRAHFLTSLEFLKNMILYRLGIK